MRRFTAMVLLCLLLAGCITMDTKVTLKRSGNIDLDFTLSSTKELMGMMKQGMKEGMNLSADIIDKVTISETDTSITYSMRDIDTNAAGKLFSNDESDGMMPLDLAGIDAQVHPGFPYITYVLNIPLPAAAQNNTDESTQLAQAMMSGMITMTFTLETFGTIIDTNGKLLDEHTVQWDLLSTDRLYVKFHDPVLAIWLGDYWFIYTAIIGGLLAAVLTAAIIRKRRRNPKAPKAPPVVPSEVLAFVMD
ncbi:hypothetical protein COV94_01160, partial [Candidatus Woesearchaeota archaeon CG11_big_fil_rev_8_21_14_0_20_57_5]